MSSPIGVLLINVGSPNHPNFFSVARYLNEFLCDPKVINLPWVARQALVKGVVVPFRSKESAKAYRSVWLAEGAPLKVYSAQLAQKLSAQLGAGFRVVSAMRYQKPSIQTACQQLAKMGCERLIVLPMYPQYAAASTGTAIAAVQKIRGFKEIEIIRSFYREAFFIQAWRRHIQFYLNMQNYDYVLMSFHGLPVSQNLPEAGLPSYEQQCIETAHLIAQGWDIETGLSFQSRLGKTPWIQPYTDEKIEALYKKGVRKLLVACPAFTIDCLETLEEINMALREQWLELGGDVFECVPCLNVLPFWVAGLARWIQNNRLVLEQKKVLERKKASVDALVEV